MQHKLSKQTLDQLLIYQQDEINDHALYQKMAQHEKDPKNKATLEQIAQDELNHAAVWEGYTGKKVGPNKIRLVLLNLMSLLFGYTFIIKLTETKEHKAALGYTSLLREIPAAKEMVEQENHHEQQLADILDEQRLQYVGAIVLGLNDALVELTGTIAGLTFAMSNNRVVALTGIITGIAATLSMAASNYLAERADNNPKAFTSSLYTGVAYLITVICLVLPYLLFPASATFAAFATMLVTVLLIILLFNYYISVAKSQPFWRRFGEMACISLGVAAVSFCIGLLVKQFLGISV